MRPSTHKRLSRRSLLAGLATATAGALAGCVLDRRNDSSLSIRLESVDRSALGESLLVGGERGNLGPTQRRLVEEGVPNGTVRYGHRPIEDGEFVAADGDFYAVSVTENGSGAVTRPVLSAERVETADGEVGTPGDLPEYDALALRCAVSAAREGERRPCVLHAGNASAFWPTPAFEYVELGEETYRVDSRRANVTLDRYRYGFRRVARNRSAFAEYVAQERIAVDFDEGTLSEREREILRTAAEEGVYREEPPYSDALEDLADRIRRAGGFGTGVYAKFEGEYYLASIRQIFDD